MPVAYIFMMLLMWLFPPRWVKGFTDDLADWFGELKVWGPRLVGAVRWDNVDEVKGKANKEASPLIQTLMMVGELAPLIEKLPAIMQMVNQSGLLSEGTLAAPAPDGVKPDGSVW